MRQAWCTVQVMTRPMLAGIAVAAVAAFAPSAASGASIGLTDAGGSRTITYAARPGEVNALELHGTVGGPGDFRMPFFEFSAPLTAGASCTGGEPVICGVADRAFPVAIALGDEDDVASANSFSGELALDAGPGSDDVLAGGIEARADGGSGGDTIVLAANGLTTGNGNSGRDRLHGGLGAAAAILTGGIGRDLLVPGGSLFDRAEGGPGNDNLVSFTGDAVTLSGQSGADLLIAPAGRGRITFDGGSGADVVASHLGRATVDAGPGTDIVDVRGGGETAADTVNCGTGADVVYADAGDGVASDCEVVLDRTPPAFHRAVSAEAAARALVAHRPDPAGV